MVNKGEGTKAGSDGGEKQIAAERKNTQGPAGKKKRQSRRSSSEVDAEPSGQGLC